MSAQSAIDSVINSVKSKHAATADSVVATVIDVSDFQDPNSQSASRNLNRLTRGLRQAGLYSGLFKTPRTGSSQFELRTTAQT
jgi:hypothetical protein